MKLQYHTRLGHSGRICTDAVFTSAPGTANCVSWLLGLPQHISGLHPQHPHKAPSRLQRPSQLGLHVPGTGVWRHRQRGCCTPRSAPHVESRNSQNKHPDQIPQLGHGQIDLFARSKCVTRCVTSHPAHACLGQPSADLGFICPPPRQSVYL